MTELGTFYENGLRIPMIVNMPSMIPTGSECSFPIHAVDFLPTYLELAGAAATDLPGLSFADQLSTCDTSRKVRCFVPLCELTMVRSTTTTISQGIFKPELPRLP